MGKPGNKPTTSELRPWTGNDIEFLRWWFHRDYFKHAPVPDQWVTSLLGWAFVPGEMAKSKSGELEAAVSRDLGKVMHYLLGAQKWSMKQSKMRRVAIFILISGRPYSEWLKLIEADPIDQPAWSSIANEFNERLGNLIGHQNVSPKDVSNALEHLDSLDSDFKLHKQDSDWRPPLTFSTNESNTITAGHTVFIQSKK